jgi:hypothetical protein
MRALSSTNSRSLYKLWQIICPRPSGVSEMTRFLAISDCRMGFNSGKPAMGSIRAACVRNSPTVCSPRNNNSAITASSTLSTPSQSYI